ncbi:MAG: DDE-type integrase/transposase/recombinase [Candidatus Thiodiazotropha sp. (ex Lucinoma kastoroae)]|nr:DDE-type integrase/transposase/recombinase [Candidatus Thiodiazotropha sp. (ex Lucinoma kastoroae)]
MHAKLGTIDYFRSLAERLNDAAYREHGKLIEDAKRFLGISRSLIYQGLREHAGWESGRKQRADKGISILSDDEARAIAIIMVESSRANGKRLLSCGDSLAIARANGLVKANISATTAQRVMRERGFHPDQIELPTPHTELRSLHPNHVWEFDVSICVLYYMDSGGLSVMERKQFYKNKPQNYRKVANDRVLRYLMTDHATGTLFFRYYLSPGEDQETLYKFLMEAFTKRDNDQDPFHGVPYLFIWDAGSANQSHLIRNLLDRLDVRHWPHMPGNPRAKGQVESSHNIVECKFEGRLCLMHIRSLEHLNEMAHIWMRHFNGTAIHTRHGHTRYGLWQTIQPQQLRIAPPKALCDELLRTKPERRQVKGNLTIQYKVKGYDAKVYSVENVPDIRVKDYVEVCVNPYKAPSIYVIGMDENGIEAHYACDPIEQDAFGFSMGSPIIGQDYHSASDTTTDKHRKAMMKEAYGVDTLADVDKARKKRLPAYSGKVDPISYLSAETSAHYMQRPGTQLGIPDLAQAEETPLSVIEVAKKLVREHGIKMDQEKNALLREWYPDGVKEAAFFEVLERLESEDSPKASTANFVQ